MNYVAASVVTDRQTDRQTHTHTHTHTHTQTDYRNPSGACAPKVNYTAALALSPGPIPSG